LIHTRYSSGVSELHDLMVIGTDMSEGLTTGSLTHTP
jgi:hypothetical protein